MTHPHIVTIIMRQLDLSFPTDQFLCCSSCHTYYYYCEQ